MIHRIQVNFNQYKIIKHSLSGIFYKIISFNIKDNFTYFIFRQRTFTSFFPLDNKANEPTYFKPRFTQFPLDPLLIFTMYIFYTMFTVGFFYTFYICYSTVYV